MPVWNTLQYKFLKSQGISLFLKVTICLVIFVKRRKMGHFHLLIRERFSTDLISHIHIL